MIASSSDRRPSKVSAAENATVAMNRFQRRLAGDTAVNRGVPKFKSVEEADRWMEKRERIQARERALMTEPQDAVIQDAVITDAWPKEWGYWTVVIDEFGKQTMMINGKPV